MQGKKVESFVTDFYTLVEHCVYSILGDEMLRDHLVVGIRSSKLSKKLHLDPNLTLERALTKIRWVEAVKQQQPVDRGELPELRAEVLLVGVPQ